MQKITITTADEAEQYAIDWQVWVAEQNLSYGEMSDWQSYFTTLAEQFDLVEVFQENAII